MVTKKKELMKVQSPNEEKLSEAKSLTPFAQLADQYKLPVEQIKNLIHYSQTPTDNLIRLAVETARTLGVPLQGITLIPNSKGGNVYINSDGIRWLVHNSPRGLKSITSEVLHRPTKDAPWWEVKCITSFADGSFFDGIGSVMVDKDWNEANGLMKAETKAERRSGYKATGKVLPSYDDYIEWRDQETKDITPMLTVAQSVNNGHPQTLAQFLAKLNEIKMDVVDACIKLNVATITEVKDYPAAWEKLNG